MVKASKLLVLDLHLLRALCARNFQLAFKIASQLVYCLFGLLPNLLLLSFQAQYLLVIIAKLQRRIQAGLSCGCSQVDPVGRGVLGG